MNDLNRISLVGRVGADPETHRFASGDVKASFNLATTDRWTDENNKKQEKTQWHRIQVLNPGLAKVVEQYVAKGSHLMIEGKMEYRDFEKDGVKRQAAEVVLRGYDARMVLLDSKPKP